MSRSLPAPGGRLFSFGAGNKVQTMTKRITEETAREWFELTRRGESSYQIAARYGVCHETVGKHLRLFGYAPGKGGGATARNNARRSKEAEATRIKRLNDLLADRFEVLESNQRLQSTLRCKTCGHVFKRTLDMRYEPHCPECERIRVERKRRETEELSAQRKKCRQLTKAFHLFLQAKQRDEEVNHWLDAEHVCRECGEVFTLRQRRESNPWDFSDSPTFCCGGCRKRFHNRNARHRRRERSMHGNGVSLAQLIDRDKGICYLCGKPVDREDYSFTGDGWFVTGPNYPSVDHVVPLARGGINDMSNARLAHCRCNSLKSDNLLEELEDTHREGPGGTPGLTPAA